ncbi:ATP-grasp domain-containing protein [Photobacterium leiognathi]|uniref:ATP-grasp domain-containing protein n=1 Tax=Photobacterium leiognathi TaxID=553611 RepID=UPI002738A290|nr:ATP-grasp domain-containing protein [Photobacterium leiognathi]
MSSRIALVHPSFDVPFLFLAAEKNDVELVLILPQDQVVPAGLPAIVGKEILPIYADPDDSLDKIVDLTERWGLDGIMAVKEQAVVWTANACIRTGLRGISPQSAIAARDKYQMRKLFCQAGLPVPYYHVVHELGDVDILPDLKYPCVVKPVSGYNSEGVQLASNEEQLLSSVRKVLELNDNIYKAQSWHPEGHFHGVIIEEFIEGPEYVVEMFAWEGEVVALNCGYKGQPRGPYFEESVYLCPADTGVALTDAIQKTAIRGMQALGLNNGPGHCELRLSPDGTPYILEIAARIGGSGCAHFNVEASSGIDFAGLWFKWLNGSLNRNLWPPKSLSSTEAASSWIMPLGGEGELIALEGIEQASEHPDCKHILIFAEPGKVYRPYPHFDGFLAIIFGKHENHQSGKAFLNFLDNTISAVWLKN